MKNPAILIILVCSFLFSCGDEGGNYQTQTLGSTEESVIEVDLTVKTEGEAWLFCYINEALPGFIVLQCSYLGGQEVIEGKLFYWDMTKVPGVEDCSQNILPEYPLFTCDWTYTLRPGIEDDRKGAVVQFHDGQRTESVKIIFTKYADIVIPQED